MNTFHLTIIIFSTFRNCYILHGHVFVMVTNLNQATDKKIVPNRPKDKNSPKKLIIGRQFLQIRYYHQNHMDADFFCFISCSVVAPYQLSVPIQISFHFMYLM